MNNVTLLVLLVACAFLAAFLGRIISFYRERGSRPYYDRGARRIETISFLLAAVLIVIAVVLQVVPASSAPNLDGNVIRTPSGILICVPGTLNIDGSSALYQLTDAVAKDYQAKCPQATIHVSSSSSKEGLTLLEAGKIQIADSDLSAQPTQGDLVDHRIAVVVFTLVVNLDVTGLTSLTQDQIKGIFSHAITNWRQVGGPDLQITTITRIPSSGTRSTFEDYVLCGPESPPLDTNNEVYTTAAMSAKIQQTQGAIGYVDLGTALASHLNIIAINGNTPLPELVKRNTYSFWNVEHMYTKGLPASGGLTNAFIQYITNTPTEELIAQGLSYVNINTMLNSGLSTHQSCR